MQCGFFVCIFWLFKPFPNSWLFNSPLWCIPTGSNKALIRSYWNHPLPFRMLYKDHISGGGTWGGYFEQVQPIFRYEYHVFDVENFSNLNYDLNAFQFNLPPSHHAKCQAQPTTDEVLPKLVLEKLDGSSVFRLVMGLNFLVVWITKKVADWWLEILGFSFKADP